MTIGVYALIFSNDNVYIGSSAGSCEGRLYKHLLGLRKGLHSNRYMQRLFNKYGKPEFMILQECGNPKGMRIKEIIIRLREQAWIEAQDKKMCINVGSAYPNSMYGKLVSEKTRGRMSKAQKGRYISEEHRHKISDSTIGKHHSEGTKKKMSVSMYVRKVRDGYINSPETRKKLSEINKGKKLSKEHRRKISEAVKQHWAQKRSENDL